MKYSIIIADTKLLLKSEIKTWINIGKISIEPQAQTSKDILKIIDLIKLKYPDIPNNKGAENYLIFEKYADFFTMDIQYDTIEKMKEEIIEIALHNGFAVLIGKENKIYKPN